MKWLPSKDNIFLWFIILALVGILVLNIGTNKINENSPVEEIPDTTTNSVVIDSIEYRIQYKDSVITNITYVYEEEILKAESLDDSSAVELFKELCTGCSLYGQDK